MERRTMNKWRESENAVLKADSRGKVTRGRLTRKATSLASNANLVWGKRNPGHVV